MDPDETLESLRALSRNTVPNTEAEAREQLFAFQTLFNALDDWMSNDGFAPKGWRRPPTLNILGQ
jgi:hypothetical protein